MIDLPVAAVEGEGGAHSNLEPLDVWSAAPHQLMRCRSAASFARILSMAAIVCTAHVPARAWSSTEVVVRVEAGGRLGAKVAAAGRPRGQASAKHLPPSATVDSKFRPTRLVDAELGQHFANALRPYVMVGAPTGRGCGTHAESMRRGRRRSKSTRATWPSQRSCRRVMVVSMVSIRRRCLSS